MTCDQKTLSKCVDVLEKCRGIKKVKVEIDNKIDCPKWVEKRIKNFLYNLFVREKFLRTIKPKNIVNYCYCAIVTICPLCTENIVCSLDKKGKDLQIYFTLS